MIWRRMRLVRLLAILVAALAALGAATSAYVWERSLDHVSREGDLVLLRSGKDPLVLTGLIDSDRSFNIGVGFGGTLSLVGGRCFGVTQDDRKYETVLVWPDDTRIQRRGNRLGLVTGGAFVAVGENIEGGASLRTDWTAFDGDLPEVCNGPLTEFAIGE